MEVKRFSLTLVLIVSMSIFCFVAGVVLCITFEPVPDDAKVFGSIDELVSFLERDKLNEKEWALNYTCIAFADDFIKRTRAEGYYCFTIYDMHRQVLEKYNDAVASINVSLGTIELRYGVYSLGGSGHRVVFASINGTDVLVDPQLDIVLNEDTFAVLYKGEITQH